MVSIAAEHISVGGNRHPAAADWDDQSGLLAFGAGNNIALWDPLDRCQRGVHSLLSGHTDKVTAVRFYTCPYSGKRLLLTGSVDRTIHVWLSDGPTPHCFAFSCKLEGHQGTINTLAATWGSDIIVSGAADGTAKVWRLECRDGEAKGQLLKTIQMKPMYFPLALSLKLLDSENALKPMALAIAGTTNLVQIYVAQTTADGAEFRLCANLSGHEAWVRSLAFTEDNHGQIGDLLLASASQDKYIRLWKLHRGEMMPLQPKCEEDNVLGCERTLSNKAYVFEALGSRYSVTFEALLLGHEDWVYTVAWSPGANRTQLLSASADNSLTIWEPDPMSGVWMSMERMGEISSQKGSTSATGSAGGFWIGLWSPGGREVVSLARTGSWRVWKYSENSDLWLQAVGISGHVQSVNDIQWEAEGGYLLSTSTDQTTRLYAKWLHDGWGSWHEFSRPQIHGYDLNCIDSLGSARFVSGADEKLLRVFDEPKVIARLLEKLSGFRQLAYDEMPDTANIPVLGLSNKAIGEGFDLTDESMDTLTDPQPLAHFVSLDLDHPPLEDHLARYTLWPEHEKLYGHGYEISAVAVNHDRSLVATACKASSIDHAVIRLYDTRNWHEVKPPLIVHSLTVTSIHFSADDRYILSVGRDRQWAVFVRNESERSKFSLLASNPKGHLRMILGAAWAPIHPLTFVTAGRDKSVKIWQMVNETIICKSTISLENPVTSVSFLSAKQEPELYLAVGEDNGGISLYKIVVNSLKADLLISFDKLLCPSKAITQLRWRPGARSSGETMSEQSAGGNQFELAVASEDSSVRIYTISNLLA